MKKSTIGKAPKDDNINHLKEASPSSVMLLPDKYLDLVYGPGSKTLLTDLETNPKVQCLRSYGEEFPWGLDITLCRALPCGLVYLWKKGIQRFEVPKNNWSHAMFKLDAGLDYSKICDAIAEKRLPLISAFSIDSSSVQALLRIDATSSGEWLKNASKYWTVFEEFGATRQVQHGEEMTALPGVHPYQTLVYFNQSLALG